MTYSMIIPVYNEEIHVKQLFKQLKTLSHNIEIIIINDGSTDKTRDILDNEDGIRIIHSPKNMGKRILFNIRRSKVCISKKYYSDGW